MPEGDSLRRVAERVRVLEGTVVSVEAPHPRAAALGIAERLDGRRLERVEAVGKNLVAGIGNVWRAEALFAARISPWRRLSDVSDQELRDVLAQAALGMHAGAPRLVHRRAGRPCTRCGAPVRSEPQGDDARVAYWCPSCQR